MSSKRPESTISSPDRSQSGAGDLPPLPAELLHPRRVVLVGASDEERSIGLALLNNLSRGAAGFEFHAINPDPIEVPGGTWHASLSDLAPGPGLAVVALPARLVPEAIRVAGEKGIRTAVVISAGLGRNTELGQDMLQAAQEAGVRILGPNCLGLMLPHAGVNASFAATDPRPGKFALLSQSGAIVTSLVEWAEAQEIGFSAILSVGDMAQTGLGELVELLAQDDRTEVILLYLEGLKEAAQFLRAARTASVSKPIIALKAGRSAAAGRAALSHTGALAGSSEVYEAALADAGIVQVGDLDELYSAAKVLQLAPPSRGKRLAILTNGGGAGILAVDAMEGRLVELAELQPKTVERLGECLPAAWSRGNPVDIIGDANAERYRASLGALLADEGCDAVLVVNCPTAVLAPAEAAAAVADIVSEARDRGCFKPVVGCWLGPANLQAARQVLRAADIPCFPTPSAAVGAFDILLKRASIVTRPASPVADLPPPADIDRARKIVDCARKQNRRLLSEIEAKQLLACFDVPVVPTRLVATAGEMAEECAGLTPPYVVKIVSPDIAHKSDIGGVAIGLADAGEAAAAAREMRERVIASQPDAQIEGFALQPMIVRDNAREVFAGLATDATFGPVILFGAGGTAIEVMDDKAIAIPPVSREEALAMIAKTRVSRLLGGYRNVPAADLASIAKVIQALSAIAEALPEIGEIDINPLLADAQGAIALDARIVLSD